MVGRVLIGFPLIWCSSDHAAALAVAVDGSGSVRRRLAPPPGCQGGSAAEIERMPHSPTWSEPQQWLVPTCLLARMGGNLDTRIRGH